MKNLLIKGMLTGVACLFVTTISAQDKKYPEPERMNPGMSEYWTPQPKIVTPGDACTNSAPSDAIVLFDGKNLDAWQSSNDKSKSAPWKVEKGAFTVTPQTGGIETKQHFTDYQLHIEWSSPEVVKGNSQGRGNSGIFMQGIYEVQVLDSYDNETYVNGQAGSIYKQTPPLANVMRKPGEWNTYDIIYTAPTFTKDGKYRTYPTITVIHNGVVVQNNTTIIGTTEYVGFPQTRVHGAGPISLQDHGDLVRFRNIWIREL